jgi:nucleotide-binding universal stress UspA family protein
VRYAADAAAARGARLTVVTAWRADPRHAGSAGRARREARRTATAVADQAAALHPALVVRVRVAEGEPAEVLAAEAEQAGLLVVGSRGRGAVAGRLLGSVSRAVRCTAACPVAVVRG